MTFWQQVPSGGVYSHLAWGPTGQLAAACDNSIHFLDPWTGSIIDCVEAAHDAAISSLEWAPVLLTAGTAACHQWLTPMSHRSSALNLWQRSALAMRNSSCAPL